MKKYWTLIVLLSTLLTACTHVEEVPITDWVHHANFPGTARATASAFVIGDNAYLCCGRTVWHSGCLNEVWKYESQSDAWTQLDTFPGKPRVKAVAVTINGKGYVGMGCNGNAYDNSVFRDFYEFDPATGKWTQKASFPDKAANDLVYSVIDGCLYTAMGFDGTGYYPFTHKYDPLTDTWTKLPDAYHAYLLTSAFAIGKNFYVGAGYQGRNLRYVFSFNTETQKWSQVASLPEGRMLSNGLAMNGKGYILLGRYWAGTENNGRLLSDIVEYDPNENAWTKRGDFPGGARQNAMVFTIRDRGYIVMGEDEAYCLSDVWSFKP